MDYDPRFPLGTPLNRKPPPAETPIAGRPGWWLDRNGVPHFVQPVSDPERAPASSSV